MYGSGSTTDTIQNYFRSRLLPSGIRKLVRLITVNDLEESCGYMYILEKSRMDTCRESVMDTGPLPYLTPHVGQCVLPYLMSSSKSALRQDKGSSGG